jgi:hypothetical protein
MLVGAPLLHVYRSNYQTNADMDLPACWTLRPIKSWIKSKYSQHRDVKYNLGILFHHDVMEIVSDLKFLPLFELILPLIKSKYMDM